MIPDLSRIATHVDNGWPTCGGALLLRVEPWPGPQWTEAVVIRCARCPRIVAVHGIVEEPVKERGWWG